MLVSPTLLASHTTLAVVTTAVLCIGRTDDVVAAVGSALYTVARRSGMPLRTDICVALGNTIGAGGVFLNANM